MRTVGLLEAKRKLSELVKCTSQGKEIGITRRGKLAAMIVPARPQRSVKKVFADIEEIRQRIGPHKGISTKDLIEEGRR